MPSRLQAQHRPHRQPNLKYNPIYGILDTIDRMHQQRHKMQQLLHREERVALHEADNNFFLIQSQLKCGNISDGYNAFTTSMVISSDCGVD